jgi:hypothetical protein
MLVSRMLLKGAEINGISIADATGAAHEFRKGPAFGAAPAGDE